MVFCMTFLGALRRGGALRLDVSGGEGRLLPALRGLPGVTKVDKLPAPAPGVLSVRLEYGENEPPQKPLFSLLSTMNAPILRLQEAESSLEEVFLRVTSGS